AQGGQFNEAIQIMQTLTSRPVQHAEFYNDLGCFQFQAGEYEAARTSLMKALKLQPSLVVAHENMGRLYEALGQTSDAIQYFQQAIQLGSRNTDIFFQLAELYIRQHHAASAQACLEQCCQVCAPVPHTVYKKLADLAEQAGQLEKAVSLYQKAIQISPRNGQLWNNLGNLYAKRGLNDEAISALGKALEYSPDEGKIFANYGNLLIRFGRHQEAIQAYQQGLELDPDNSGILNNLANTLREVGQMDQAISVYKRAIALDPDNADSYANLGNVYREQGNMDQAETAYRKAILLKPDFNEAHSNLLFFYNYTGRHTKEQIYRSHLDWEAQHGGRERWLTQEYDWCYAPQG
ncbi:MAG: tetratricopeptide repeat protein, partial [Gammaproteobacteria bacterium]